MALDQRRMKSPRRTQAERTDQTRAALLRAAVEVVARHGVADATLHQIAEAAGVSRGALAYHYHAREDIFPELVRHCGAALERAIVNAAQSEPRPASRLRAIVRALRRAPAPESSVLRELLALAPRDEALAALLAEALDAIERSLAAHLSDAASAAGLHPRFPVEHLARLALGLADGLALHAHRAPRGESGAALDDAVETVLLSVFGP
jgi:AcrR family transcriptional regulator